MLIDIIVHDSWVICISSDGLKLSAWKLVKIADPCEQVYESSSRSVVASQVSFPQREAY